MPMRKTAVYLTLCLVLSGCASGGGGMAPEPARPIDTAQFYTGRWYEIARTPMRLTDGCVAGTTDYLPGGSTGLVERDACRAGTPGGKEKVIAGPVTILNPGQNTKVSVRYIVFGFIPITRDYWMLDHASDYRWFIFSDPELKNVSIFTRAPRPSQTLVIALTNRVQALGYDPRRLEFPTEFPTP